jgi:hypothetical protein
MNLSKRSRNFYAKVCPLLAADDQEKAWAIDTASGICKITTYGAMQVLQKVGVLKLQMSDSSRVRKL